MLIRVIFLVIVTFSPVLAQFQLDSGQVTPAPKRSLTDGLIHKTFVGGVVGFGGAMGGFGIALAVAKNSGTALSIVSAGYFIGTVIGVYSAGKGENGKIIPTFIGTVAGFALGRFAYRSISNEKDKDWVLFKLSHGRFIPYLVTPIGAALAYNLSRPAVKASLGTVFPKGVGVNLERQF